MSSTCPIIVSAQIGGTAAAAAIDAHHLALIHVLRAHCKRPYSLDVDEFDIALRVDGDVGYWKLEGSDRMRRNKKSRYITIDVYVPQWRWEGRTAAEIRNYLAASIEQAIHKMIGKLQHDKVSVDEQALLSDWAQVRNDYLAELTEFTQPPKVG